MIPCALRFRCIGPARLLAPLVIVAACLGCGLTTTGGPRLYVVKGKVRYQGKPVKGGVVVYELESSEAPELKSALGPGPLRGSGRIEPDGSFRLMAFPGAEGMPAGSYKVGISSMPPRTEGNLLAAAATAQKGNPDVLQGRFADPSKSGLRDQVAEDRANEPTFDLK